jgi:hypothetical protein
MALIVFIVQLLAREGWIYEKPALPERDGWNLENNKTILPKKQCNH